MRSLTVALAAGMLCSHSAVASFTLKDGVSNWTLPGSYEEGNVPSSNDLVQLPAGRTVTLDSSDDTSWALVESLQRIVPEDDTSVFTVNVSSGDATLTTPFSNSTMSDEGGNPAYFGVGTFVKTGAGDLNLGSSAGRFCGANGNRYDYYVRLTIMAGTVKLPQEVETSGNFFYGPVAISNGATLVIMKLKDGVSAVYPLTHVWKLAGEGTVMSAGTRPLNIRAWRKGDMSVFAGKLSGTLAYYSSGRVKLTGVESDTTGRFTAYCNYSTFADNWWGGYAEVTKLGMTGEPSSVGASDRIIVDLHGGGIVYAGSGEECNKMFVMSDTIAFPGYCFIDAGAVGGIRWTGEWAQPTYNETATKTHRMVLMGSNVTECVMSGKIADAIAHGSDDNRRYPIYIIKRGTGTWRMADNANRTCGGGYAIEEGTLRYDSIAEKGTVCSLGTATNLTENYTGADLENHRVDYAYLLGSEKGATMEFTGENGGTCSTRPVVVKGTGCFKVSGSGAFSFSGFSALEAGANLVLDTARTDGLVAVGGISDGVAPLTVKKTGAGEMTFTGGASFTGGLSVEDGTLVVNGANRPYQWIRWIVKEKGFFCSRYSGVVTDSWPNTPQMQFEEFALFDSDGKRIDKGLSFYAVTNEFVDMPFGSVVQETPTNICVVQNSKNVSALFNGGAGSRSGVWGGIKILASVFPFCRMDTPKYWFKVVERLPAGANAPASFDLAGFYKNTDATAAQMVTAIALEGSTDGWNWEPIAEQNELEIPSERPRWYANTSADLVSGSSDYTLKDHVGFPMRGTSTNGVAAIVAPVSVAANAILRADGDVTLSALTLSPVGNGTIENFTFAENGVLDVAVARIRSATVLPVTFLNCKNVQNLAKWTLKIGGKNTSRHMLKVSASGEVEILPPGIILSFR